MNDNCKPMTFYSKHPHIRADDFGVQADLVLIDLVLSEKSALRCSFYVLKLCFINKK